MNSPRVSPRLLALAALGSLLTGCTPAPDPEITAALVNHDAASANIERSIADRLLLPSDEPDFRGRSFQQDAAQWVLTPDTRKRLGELRAKAEAASDLRTAESHLVEARLLLARDAKLAAELDEYWRGSSPAPYWRKYWDGLFTANEVPVATPDAVLLTLEARIREALDRGDFKAAAAEARLLPPALGDAIDRAAGRLVESRKGAASFAARRTPCPPAEPSDHRRGYPRIHSSGDLEAFYPARAKNLGEQSTVVLRVRVNRSGCGEQVATVIRSGLPEMDEAALSWFETARFSPAWKAGRTVDSTTLAKVRFRMKDEPLEKERGHQ